MPYTNVPESQWGEMDNCKQKVMDEQGYSEERAIAICHASIVEGKELKELIATETTPDKPAKSLKERILAAITSLFEPEQSSSGFDAGSVGTVFKQADGRYRWVTFSSNAFEDGDRVIPWVRAGCARLAELVTLEAHAGRESEEAQDRGDTRIRTAISPDLGQDVVEPGEVPIPRTSDTALIAHGADRLDETLDHRDRDVIRYVLGHIRERFGLIIGYVAKDVRDVETAPQVLLEREAETLGGVGLRDGT